MNATARLTALALMILAPIGCDLTPTGPELPIEPVAQQGRVGSPAAKPVIAFVSTRDSNRGEIYLMNTSGSDFQRLTNDSYWDRSPAVSPDGKKVAYASIRGGGNSFKIVTLDLETLQEEVVTPNGKNWSPTWSPDGSQIAHVKEVFTPSGSQYDIYLTNVDDGTGCSLSHHSASDLNPDWSPHGSLIAFRSDRDVASGDPSEIYVVAPVCGATPTRVTYNDAVDDMPSWSPDGDWLAVSRRGVAGNFLIAVLSYPIGSEYWITPDYGSPGPSYFSPTWSPDGTQIAFDKSPPSGSPKIQVKSSTGLGPVTTLSAMGDSNPDWWGPTKH